MLRVLGEHGREVAVERHVVADEDAIADREGKPHRFVVGVPETQGVASAVESGLQIEDAEEFHAIFGDGILVADDADLAERQTLDNPIHQVRVGDWLEGRR